MGARAQTGDGVCKQVHAGQMSKGAHRRVRTGADVCTRPYSSGPARTRLRTPADASARMHTSAKKMDPSGTHGLMHRDCSSSGWII